MHTKTLTDLSKALTNKEISSVELTQHFIDRIKQYDSTINSYITATPELALEQAQAADTLIAQGKQGILTGIPIGQKDIFCTKGVKTTCGSKMLDNFIAPYESTVTQKLKDAGMVMLGKTNMDEFAMGSSNETSFYGKVHNPWDTSRVPGGSSGGSAACIAAGLAPVATGTDTGGSIRQPAALCNLSGLKPTYGRVSRWGMIAFASSLDQAGPMARNAEDMALMLNVMAGFDEKDSTSVNQAAPDYTQDLNQSVKGLKIGLPNQFFNDKLDSSIGKLLENAIETLKVQGAEFVDINLPNISLSVPAYYVIAPAECSSNLSRFDGVRFGHRCDSPEDLQDLYIRSRSESFGEEVKRRILVGTYALSEGYYDAYYRQAQKVRRLIKQDFVAAFEQCDIILGPTSPATAFQHGAKTNDSISMYLEDIYTIGVNLAGLPAASIPCGFVNDLPIGLQLIGNYFDESRILNVANQYQQFTDWHTYAATAFEV